MRKKFYITTAIDYVNAFPHLGHALEKIQADVIARYHRILGENVFFLTGTDENSLKNVQAAKEEVIPIKKFIDRNTKKFYELKKALNLSFDDFIRTTEDRHVKGAQKLWLACQKDIYKKIYQGLYCVGCEEFYKENELVEGTCPEHKTKPELIKEENYFFRLKNYQGVLENLIEQDKIKIVPQTRKKEILSFVKSGLEDICISRLATRGQGWGVEVPGDPTQRQWVWFDALSNYINATGYAFAQKKFKKWWPADLHVIGKGIARFHAIYWPAILLSAGLPLPKKIFIHGYITVGGQKMSKSLGNVIDPFELVKKYGTDPVRYFLLREIPPTEDGDFTRQKFEGRYNSDLASGLGNLVARVVTMAAKLKMKNEKLKTTTQNLKVIQKTRRKYKKALGEFKFNEALMAIWELISFCDKYIEKKRPWEKSGNQQSVISNLLFALNHIAQMLQPFLPETSERIFKQLETLPRRQAGKKSKALFPRLN